MYICLVNLNGTYVLHKKPIDDFMKNVLVLGASFNPDRYAHMAIRKFEKKGFRVFGLGNRCGKVASIEIRTNQFSIPNLYAISLYLSAKNQIDYYDYIVNLNPEKVIFNPGAENSSLELILEQHGIYYEKACTLVLLSLNHL